MLVERSTGNTYAQEIERRLIRPLGLDGTSLPGTDPVIPGPHARGYLPIERAGKPELLDITELNPSIMNAGGDMISTAGDLNRFFAALFGGRLLPDHLVREMRTPVLDSAYGLGLVRISLPCGARPGARTATPPGTRARRSCRRGATGRSRCPSRGARVIRAMRSTRCWPRDSVADRRRKPDTGEVTGMRSAAVPQGQLPPGPPPHPERSGASIRYRNAVVAQPVGYRPLTLDLVVPEAAGPVPLVVHIYGGGFATGSHKTNSLGARLVDRLVPSGVAVAAVQYRHSREAPFPAQVHDVKAAVRWLRHHGPELGLDTCRFGAWGASSGGHLATMLAVTPDHPDLDGALGVIGPSSAVQAAVSWSAPVDLARLPPPPAGSAFHALGVDPHDWLLGARVAESPHLAAAAGTCTYVTADAAPLHLVHGE